MFGFIRKTVSTLTWPVRTAATYLLQNAVKKDRRWAIKPLIWLGADCHATFKTTYNDTTKQHHTETILSYAILNNKSLATWLLSLPVIQQQVKDDATYKALLTVKSCIVNKHVNISENLEIEQELLKLKYISAAAAVSALEQHEIYGIDTAKEIIVMVKEEKRLHESNNIILNTAIKFALYTGAEAFKHIANKLLLDNDDVKAQLKKNLAPKNQDITRQAVIKYFKDAGLLFEILDISWVIDMFAQNLGKATIVAPGMLTGHEQFIQDQQTAFNVWSKQPEPTKPDHMHEEEELADLETNVNNNGFQSPNSRGSRTPDSQGSQSPKYGVVSL